MGSTDGGDRPVSETVWVSALGYRIRTIVRRGTDDTWCPLILCNGIGAGLEAFDQLAEALDPRRTVIRFDIPGVGDSPPPLLPYAMPWMAVAVGKVADRLGYQGRQVDILGFSWGGGLAQQFAFQNPKRCRRLILAATGTGAVMVPGKFSVLSKMLTPRRYSDPNYYASIAAELYGGMIDGHSAKVHELGRRMRPSSFRGYAYQLLAGGMWTSWAALWAIRQPTLIIAGTDDPIIRAVNAKYMDKMLPHSEILWHEGGHIDPLMQGPRFAAEIDRFLE